MGRRTTYNKLIQSVSWQKIRRSILRQTPLCADCRANGINTGATDVHHIRPVETAASDAEMESLCYDKANLVALCHDCHVERHRKLNSHSKENIRENNKRATESFLRKYFEE